MYNGVSLFQRTHSINAVCLPLDPVALIKQWSGLRSVMTTAIPQAFTRDEWAYLISFLDSAKLWNPFLDCFGAPLEFRPEKIARVHRGRGEVALWLPNNVSLLGPLTLILISLTGQSLRIKAGSQSTNLTAEFLDYAIQNLPTGTLRNYLSEQVQCDMFDRHHVANQEMAQQAQVRIVFGSDHAAHSIHSLPHPLASIGFSFSDRQSQAWLEYPALTDEDLAALLRVFEIYGQAGCTSPRRVVLVDGDMQQAAALQDRLIERWPHVIKGTPDLHVASENIMAAQWGSAAGWECRAAASHASIIGIGSIELPVITSNHFLAISPAPFEQAMRLLPENIQTIGLITEKPADERWLKLASASSVKRLVELTEMHHFGTIWDGWEFWRSLFETAEVSL